MLRISFYNVATASLPHRISLLSLDLCSETSICSIVSVRPTTDMQSNLQAATLLPCARTFCRPIKGQLVSGCQFNPLVQIVSRLSVQPVPRSKLQFFRQSTVIRGRFISPSSVLFIISFLFQTNGNANQTVKQTERQNNANFPFFWHSICIL